MFGTVEWYCVITKGKIRVFFFFWKRARLRLSNFTIESGLSMKFSR